MIPDTRQTWRPSEHKTSPRPPPPRQLILLSSSLKPAEQQKMTWIMCRGKKEVKMVKDTTQTSTNTWARENTADEISDEAANYWLRPLPEETQVA